MEADGFTKSKSINDADWLQPIEDLRPFDAVCEALAALGALTVDDFLSGATSAVSGAYGTLDYHQIYSDPPELEKENDPQSAKVLDKESESKLDVEAEDATTAMNKMNHVMVLRQASQSVFGSSECLNWEYMEEAEPISKQCILTITRPSGATRSYKSDKTYTRRADARAQAAQIAIEMGAIDFIISGDSDALKTKKGLLLNPFHVDADNLDHEVSATAHSMWSVIEEPLKMVEDCCKEWRAGKVKLHWVSFNDTKNKKKHGIALRISLNPYVFRSYSVDPVHNSIKQAKIACARAAIDEGVLDFIRYGNGQTEPPKITAEDLSDRHDESRDTPPPMPKGITLQEFYESLPQPFPEDVGDKSAGEINGPAWLNLTLQSARGQRLTSRFTPVLDSINHLHGSILRLERPDETRTYLVDPQFPKRSDAKSAVCLLAMSQGVGGYIRGLKEQTEQRLPADMRKLANEKILQTLTTECSKIRQGNQLNFKFTKERDAFGCVLIADLSTNATQPDIREYSVKTEYRTKADAKAALAYHAAEQGLVDLLRFKGGPLPADYIPFWEAQIKGDGDNYVPKRKEPERDLDGEGRDRKKRKKGSSNGYDQSDASSQSDSRRHNQPPAYHLPKKPTTLPPPNTFSSNTRWKGPRATGSRGLGIGNAHAPALRSTVQDQPGHRSGGAPPRSQGHYITSPLNSPMSRERYSMHPRSPGYSYEDRADLRQRSEYQATYGYGPTDHYGNTYPSYPSRSASSHYPGSALHSPAPPPPPPLSLPTSLPPPPPPPHHHSGYYATPSIAPPNPHHTPYGSYAYQPHYSPHYPHGIPSPYPGTYSPHHPGPIVYSPLPHPISHGHHVHLINPSSGPAYPYPPVDNRSHNSRRPTSPPAYSHHVFHPSHPALDSYVSSRQANNCRRRHSTVADFRNRDGRPSVSPGNNRRSRSPPPQ